MTFADPRALPYQTIANLDPIMEIAVNSGDSDKTQILLNLVNVAILVIEHVVGLPGNAFLSFACCDQSQRSVVFSLSSSFRPCSFFSCAKAPNFPNKAR
jgi:hypothetical protein